MTNRNVGTRQAWGDVVLAPGKSSVYPTGRTTSLFQKIKAHLNSLRKGTPDRPSPHVAANTSTGHHLRLMINLFVQVLFVFYLIE